MNDEEKLEEDDSLILAWEQYIQGQAELIENIRPEFQKVIQTYFMKNNKKIKKALDHINRFLAEREENKNTSLILLSDITDIKKILEK